MNNNFETSEEQEQQEDYEIKQDGAFTLDEQEEISNKREELEKEVERKRTFLKVSEAIGVNIVCYSIGRWLILMGGYSQVGFVCALTFLFQQILNRDMLSDFNVNYDGGWQISRMDKIFRVLGTLVTSGVLCWLTVGDIVNSSLMTQRTYEAIRTQTEIYNAAPKDQQIEILKSVGLAVFVTIVILAIFTRLSSNNAE